MTLAAVGVFVLSMLLVSLIELFVLGHPLSGGPPGVTTLGGLLDSLLDGVTRLGLPSSSTSPLPPTA